ncbi:hypothetical protein OAO18_07130 [Francisellaceae bacterium]|nr:hypothetical protein [Francisellaceae bacterium]
MKLKKIAALSLAGLAFMSTSSFANVSEINNSQIERQNLQGIDSDFMDFGFDFLSDKSILPFPLGAYVKDIYKGPLKKLFFPSITDPTQDKLDNITNILVQMQTQLADITLIDQAVLNRLISLSDDYYINRFKDKVEKVEETPSKILSKNRSFLPLDDNDPNKSIYPFPKKDNEGIYEYALNLYNGSLASADINVANLLKGQFVDVDIKDSKIIQSNSSESLMDLYNDFTVSIDNATQWNNFYSGYVDYVSKKTDSNGEFMAPLFEGNIVYGQVNMHYTQAAESLYNMFKVLIAFKYTHRNDFKNAVIPSSVHIYDENSFANYQQSIKELDNTFEQLLKNYQSKVVDNNKPLGQEQYIERVINNTIYLQGKSKVGLIRENGFEGCNILSLSMSNGTKNAGKHLIGHLELACGNKLNHFDIPYKVLPSGDIKPYISGIYLDKDHSKNSMESDYIRAASEYKELGEFVKSNKDAGWKFNAKLEYDHGNRIYNGIYVHMENRFSSNLNLSNEVLHESEEHNVFRTPATWQADFGGRYIYPYYHDTKYDIIPSMNDKFFIHTINGHIFSAQNWIPRLEYASTSSSPSDYGYQHIVMNCLDNDNSCHNDIDGKSLHWDDGTTITSKQTFGTDKDRSGLVTTTAYTTADFTDKVILDGHVNKSLQDGSIVLTSNNKDFQLEYEKEVGGLYILNVKTGEKKPAFNLHDSQVQNIKSIKFEHGNVELFDQYGGQIWTAQKFTLHDGMWVPSPIAEDKTNYIALQDDGNLVIYDKNATPLWSNNQ